MQGSQDKAEVKYPDWEKYGLSANSQDDVGGQYGAADDSVFEPGGQSQNDLFHEEQKASSNSYGEKPWWKANFFLSEPVLFGTWDGVFTSCMINLFGVIIFLRAGWIVGNAGIGQSVLIILTTVIVCSVAVLSGIVICEQCQIQSGGIHFLISHVLGAQIGGAIGIIYCFGQAVSCALHVMGFAESMSQVLKITNPWLERSLALGVILLLIGINVAGVKWVIRLQFFLLIILLLAALDFAVGTFVHTDPDHGVIGYDLVVLQNNTMPDYMENENWFTVFGVFFPAMTGIFAGVNMSGDLRNPSKDIPVGTLTSIGVSLFLYLLFIMGLGATCLRSALQSNYMIAENVSALGVLLLCGLYISTMSSCLGALYSGPRIIQSMATESVMPASTFLGKGIGPNKVPVNALVVFALVTFVFIAIGHINTLAPIVTIPFLLTYISVEYAYFSLSMTYDLQKEREARFSKPIYDSKGADVALLASPSFDLRKDKGFAKQFASYGTTSKEGKHGELDQLFPERISSKTSTPRSPVSCATTSGSVNTAVQFPHRRHSQSTTESPLTSPDEHSSVKSAESKGSTLDKQENYLETDDKMLLLGPDQNQGLQSKTRAWYSLFCNRWIAILGLLSKVVIMFLVQWGYALSMLLAIAVFWIYIGQANPGTFPGITEFKLFPWLKRICKGCCGGTYTDYDQIVVTPLHPGVEVMAAQLNEENEDYASREPYHHSKTMKSNPGTRFQDFDSD